MRVSTRARDTALQGARGTPEAGAIGFANSEDLVLLGVSIWTAGEALQAAADRDKNSSGNRV